MSYFIMPRPFFDFLAIQFSAEVSVKDAASINNRNSNCDWLDSRSVVLTYHDNRVSRGEGVDTLLSGYAYDKEAFFYDNPKNMSVTDSENCFNMTGKFTFLSFRNGTFKFCADTFGQGVLFYYVDDVVSIVSNRVHFIVEILKTLKRKIELDLDTIIHQNFYDVYIFNAYCSTKDLFIKNLKQLGVDEELEVSNGSINVLPKAFYKTEYSISESGYQAYLDDGAAELKSFFNGMKKQKNFSTYLLDISGGKDSRVIVAGMLAAEIDPKTILGQTYATASELDDKIGIAITEHFGIRPTSSMRVFSPRIPVGIEDYVDCYVSFFAGTYYLLNAGGLSSYGQVSNVARFAGTSSNVLRAGSSGTLKAIFEDLVTSDVDGFFDRFTEKFGSSKLFSQEVTQRARLTLRKVISNLPGTTVPEKLEAIHHNFGARYHGGLASIFQSWVYGPVFNPILTKGLYAAAQSLPLDERVDGRLFFDVVHRLSPELATFNYDKKFPYAEMQLKKLGLRPKVIDKSYKTKPYYEEVGKQRKAAKYYFLTDKESSFGAKLLFAEFRSRFERAWNFLDSNYNYVTRTLGDRLRREIMTGLDKERESAKRRALVFIAMAHVLQ